MKNYKQISTKPGFMKHNGGLLFCKISKSKYLFKTKITKKHINRAGITHGGYIASIIDSGAGSAAHGVSDNRICVTISLDIKFIGSTKIGDEIIGNVEIEKITKSLVFLRCTLRSKNKVVASASGVWKKLNKFFK